MYVNELVSSYIWVLMNDFTFEKARRMNEKERKNENPQQKSRKRKSSYERTSPLRPSNTTQTRGKK